MENFKGTKGKWEAKLDGQITTSVYVGDKQIMLRANVKEEAKANAILIADAGNVRQQISFDLPELLEQRNEMLEALQEFCDRVEKGEVRSTKTYNKFKELIKQATEVKP